MSTKHSIDLSPRAKGLLVDSPQAAALRLLLVLALSLLALSLIVISLPKAAWAAEDGAGGIGGAISAEVEPEATWSTTVPEFIVADNEASSVSGPVWAGGAEGLLHS